MIDPSSEEQTEDSISGEYNAFEEENGGAEIIDRVIIEAYFDNSELQGSHQISLSGQTLGEILFYFFGYPRTGIKVTAFCERWVGTICMINLMIYVINMVLSWFFWSQILHAIVLTLIMLFVSITLIMLLQYEFLKLLCCEYTWWLQMVNLWLSATAYFYASKKIWDSGLMWVTFSAVPLVFAGSSFDAIGLKTMTPKTRFWVWATILTISVLFVARESSRYAVWDKDFEKNVLFYGKQNMHDLALYGMSGTATFSAKNLWAAFKRPGEFHMITASVKRKQDVLSMNDSMFLCFNSCKKKVVKTSIGLLENGDNE